MFLTGLEDNVFPLSNSLMESKLLEEERRLMYVAVTRAKENLFLSYPVSIYTPKDGHIMARPSRFINDIPRSMFETTDRRPETRDFRPQATDNGQRTTDKIRDADDEAELKTKDGMLQVGAHVHHTIFGTGRVIQVLDGQKVVVHFEGKGLKTLHLGYTTLSVIR